MDTIAYSVLVMNHFILACQLTSLLKFVVTLRSCWKICALQASVSIGHIRILGVGLELACK